MDDRQGVAWLHRRAGFGLHPTELDAAAARGTAEELARPATPAIPTDPWIGVELDPEQGGRRAVIGAWLRHLIDTSTPFADRRTYMGDTVQSGLHGSIDLDDLVEGDLRPTIDPGTPFTACLDWLGADVEAILGARSDELGLLT